MRQKRSTTGEAAVPYYRLTDIKEAAKHLALTARRFVNDNANTAEVCEAIELWQSELHKLNVDA